MICPKCNKYRSDADKYCYLCGSKLIENPFCTCGRELISVDRYCPNCGKVIDRRKEVI